MNEKQNDAVSTMLSKEMLKNVEKFRSKKDGQGPGKDVLAGWKLKELRSRWIVGGRRSKVRFQLIGLM